MRGIRLSGRHDLTRRHAYSRDASQLYPASMAALASACLFEVEPACIDLRRSNSEAHAVQPPFSGLQIVRLSRSTRSQLPWVIAATSVSLYRRSASAVATFCRSATVS